MTDAPGNLNDFFSAHKKKDKKKKAKAAAAEEKPAEEPAAESKNEAAETAKVEKPSADAHDTQVASKSKKKATTFDDSDEEEGNIVLKDELRSKLKMKTEVDASRRNEEEKKNEADGLGWSFGERLAPKQAATAQPAEPEKKASSGGAFNINFQRGPPKFTKATTNNKVIQKQEFPELGDFRSKKANDEVLKKDGNYGANETRTSAAAAPKQERMEFKMPVFSGKAKLNFGTGDEDTGARQYNYDMSSLKKSTASSKPAPKGDQSGKNFGQSKPRNFGGDDDFETVTDKKKQRPQRGGFGKDD